MRRSQRFPLGQNISQLITEPCLSVLSYSIIPKRKGRDNGSIHIPNQDHPRMVIGILKCFSATAGDNTSARSGSQGLSFYMTEGDAKTAGCRLFDSGRGIPAADSVRNLYVIRRVDNDLLRRSGAERNRSTKRHDSGQAVLFTVDRSPRLRRQ